MTSIERKARKYVKGLYFDYKDIKTHETFSDYYDAMLMLRNLFPDSTNEETLERTWDVEWKKENRDD